MAIEKAQDRITIKHSSGAKVEVLKYGATVISWTLANGEKQLFLSEYNLLQLC
jgi:D-hexose-6-phosphate mutarotase